MCRPKRSSRRAWLAVGLLLVVCMLLVWIAFPFISSEWRIHLANKRVSSRLEYVNEAADDRARQSRQIRSLIELAAEHIQSLGGTCKELDKKYGSNGLPNIIDLSKWRGKDPDLALLRVFRLLKDTDSRDGYFSLSLPPTTTDAGLAYVEDLRIYAHWTCPGPT